MREKVKHEDLKVGDKLDLEHTDYGSARVDILDVKRTVKVEIASGTLKGSSGFAHGKGETFRYYLENCTFYRVPAEPETPHIELKWNRVTHNKQVAFRIETQRGDGWEEFYHDDLTLAAPNTQPQWIGTILYPRGRSKECDDNIMICTAADWQGIKALVAAFNKHHADLAEEATLDGCGLCEGCPNSSLVRSYCDSIGCKKAPALDRAHAKPKPAPEEKGSVVCLCCSCGNVMTEGLDCEGDAECTSCGHPRNGHNGEPGWLEGDRLDDIREYSGAKKPTPEAKPEPRMIMPTFELGSDTTGTECRDCNLHACRGMDSCRVNDSGRVMRHATCLAAEKRYKDWLLMMARGEEK